MKVIVMSSTNAALGTFLLLVSGSSVSRAFAPSSTTTTIRHDQSMSSSQRRVLQSSRQEHHDPVQEVDQLKADIARMRQEALQKLDALNRQMHVAEQAWQEQQVLDDQVKREVTSSSSTVSLTPVPPVLTANDVYSFDEAAESDKLYQARMERERRQLLEREADGRCPMPAATMTQRPSPSTSTTSSNARLLEDTRWRLMLNIGREPGTWMPKTWGVSGERLRLHLELEFSPLELYEREDFLNAIAIGGGAGGGAKQLQIHGKVELAPNMQHGGRTVRVRPTGGWRVAPQEGPLGTSVLRFYFDLEEEVRHAGSDIYCPAGRVYCTCGYFPLQDRHKEGYVSLKDALKEERRQLEARYEKLAAEDAVDTDWMSWKKIQRSKELTDLRREATQLNHKLHEAQVREPDRSLLRLSQDQSVGLTREGGVCCKVHKGLAIEYHILGKFEIASMENREHSDYRNLLP